MNGITRAKVIDVCEGIGIPCYQKDFSLFDVYGADEAFVTGTFGGLTPVMHIDGKPIDNQNGASLRADLDHLYEELIANESKS